MKDDPDKPTPKKRSGYDYWSGWLFILFICCLIAAVLTAIVPGIFIIRGFFLYGTFGD